ncbi:MAG: hypothetical protein ACRC3G_01515 [Bacteroidales bacterium]
MQLTPPQYLHAVWMPTAMHYGCIHPPTMDAYIHASWRHTSMQAGDMEAKGEEQELTTECYPFSLLLVIAVATMECTLNL